MSKYIRLAESHLVDGKNIFYRVHTPQANLSMHGHNFYELDVILDGESLTTLNGETFEIKKGSAFFLTPNDFHEFPKAGVLKFFNVHFTEDAVSSEILERFIAKESRSFKLSDESFDSLLSFIDAFLSLKDSPSKSKITSNLLECVLLLLDTEKATESVKNLHDMQKAITYIYAHFKENPSLSEMASFLALNEKYFCKKFHDYTGETYKSYLRKMKLHYARQLIINTNKSFLEIALESGYETQSHFNREFKQFYNTTPLELRKSKQTAPCQ